MRPLPSRPFRPHPVSSNLLSSRKAAKKRVELEAKQTQLNEVRVRLVSTKKVLRAGQSSAPLRKRAEAQLAGLEKKEASLTSAIKHLRHLLMTAA